MADRHIDLDETSIYGTYAVRQIRKRVVGLVPEYDSALRYTAARLEAATQETAQSVAAARSSDTEVRKGTQKKAPALEEGLDVLGRFSSHLAGHKQGAVDRKRFFGARGTASSIGRRASKVLLALDHIAVELGKSDHGVKDAESWRAEVQAVAAALRPAVDHTDDARADRRELTLTGDEQRSEWHVVYLAAKSLVEAVLRLRDKLELMPRIFHDLAVPADTKVTEIPPDDDTDGAEATAA